MIPDLNAVRYRAPAPHGHVESYFLKANDPRSQRAVWLRATIFASDREPERPLAEGWAIAFDHRGGSARNVAVKHALPFAEASFSASGLDVRWQQKDSAVALSPGNASGHIEHRGHRIDWDLRYSGGAEPIVPFPFAAMYRGPFPRTKTVTPSPDARFDGEVLVDGDRWEIAGWHGMQGHNWGRGHAERYAWSHINAWDDGEDFVLEGVSARVALGPLTTPAVTLICVRRRGVAYDFTAPRDLIRATGDIGHRRWDFSAQSARARIEGTVEASTDDLVGLYYPNPDGAMTYCLNTKLARARVRFEASGSPPETFLARKAALEIGTRDDAHGVRMYV